MQLFGGLSAVSEKKIKQKTKSGEGRTKRDHVVFCNLGHFVDLDI